MSQKQVWYPERSYTATTQLGSEEGGRGSLHASSSEQDQPEATTRPSRRKQPIPRRRTPTVTIPLAAATAASSGANNTPTPTGHTPPCYTTIEAVKRVTLRELSGRVYEKPSAPPPKNHNWFQGWTEWEHIDLHQSNKMTTALTGDTAGDRSRLQTPASADGYRSGGNSRVGSSSRYVLSRHGRRASQYVFRHHDTVQQHMEEYHNMCSFTGLTTSHAHSKDGKMLCEGEDVEQDDEVVLPIGVRSLYRGDPHLRELVHRLGIKDPPPVNPEWERPRPTPPSIVKRRRNGRDVNIVVSNSAPKREEMVQELDETDVTVELTPILTQDDSAELQAVQQESKQDNEEDGTVELPNISRTSQLSRLLQQIYQRNGPPKSTSVISVQKYLRVKSRNHETLTEEEEDLDEEDATEVQASKERTSTREESKSLDQNLSKQKHKEQREGNIEFEDKSAKFGGAAQQEQLLTMSRGQKEKLISNTAHALGVVSRDWGKVPGLRRVVSSRDEQSSMSRSPTRQSKSRAEHRNQIESRMGYRSQITAPLHSGKGNVKSELDSSNSKSKVASKEMPMDERKIDKLKSIYDTSHRTKSKSVQPSRQPSRCASRHASRPATRMQVYKTHQQLHQHQQQQQVKGKQQYSQSRPVTRATNYHHHPVQGRDGNVESLEESMYWNELHTNNKASKPKSFTGARKTATVFGVVDNHERKLDDVAQQLHRSLKMSPNWGVAGSAGIGDGGPVSKKREGTRGKEVLAAGTGTDKIAQAISLAMKFRKPRESLMRKLTGGVGASS